MALYDRLGGFELPKIPVHAFMGAMQEYVLDNMSGAQATAAFGLSGAEQTEALALKNKILEESNANNNAFRKLKAVEIERVLFLLEARIAPFNTVALVKTRLGVT